MRLLAEYGKEGRKVLIFSQVLATPHIASLIAHICP
jgi:hypothetical protein